MSWRSTRAAGHTPGGNRRLAVIDLGSNSWRLVEFTHASGGEWWKRTDELFETVRIGAGQDASGELARDAIERGMETLSVFARFLAAGEFEAPDVIAFATSAVRDAANRQSFLAAARNRSGLDIEVLSGEQEAELGYVAAVNSTTLENGTVLEIGGGSLQLIAVENRRRRELVSLPLGALRMTERYLPGSGPARRKEIARLRDHVAEELRALTWLGERGARVVGLGGAVRNLAAADLGERPIDLGVQGSVIGSEALSTLVHELAALPAAQRGMRPGIKPGRGDIILAAAVVIQTALEVLGAEGLEVTEAGLRDGVFFARRLLAGRDPLLPDVRVAAVENLAVQYESDLDHVRHVAVLSLSMHRSLAAGGMFTPAADEEQLLWAAAMLHDVGMTISYDDHHKHSRYLILSAGLPGFDPRERGLIAQMSRYHRKGAPKLGEVMAGLARPGDESLLERCAVILRLAEHLERGRDQSVLEAALRPSRDGVAMCLEAAGDLTLPRWSVERYGDGEAFERVFGRRLLIGGG